MSQFISLSTAVGMTTLYRQDSESLLATANKNKNILPTCETFDRGCFDSILAQSGCTGIRIYYGMDSNSKLHAVIVGVNSSDEDIIFPSGDNSLIVETGRRCPDDCPAASDLNS